MENLTHSLVGATIAELALPSGASPRQRQLFFTASVLAANLPDADLVYARIMPPPLGYLLHHRGHTHTLVGLIGLAVLVGLVTLLPTIRALVAFSPGRFWLMTAAALLSHIVLDSWNSYGVHPFWPVDRSWYYGDSVSIFEPWLWVILGVTVGANTLSRRWRVVFMALPFALVSLATLLRVIARPAGIVLLVVAVLLMLVLRGWKPRSRALAGACGAALFVALGFLFTHQAYARVAAGLHGDATLQLLDVALTPLPAQPLCRSALAMEKSEARGVYVLRHGKVSVAPSGLRWLGCSAPGVTWMETTTQSLAELRAAFARDCWMRDWMQFGRAPVIETGVVSDARFGGDGSFTSMTLSDGERGCPAYGTGWGMPREDLLVHGR